MTILNIYCNNDRVNKAKAFIRQKFYQFEKIVIHISIFIIRLISYKIFKAKLGINNVYRVL